ncbi:MAG: hypothetical protein ACJ739_11580 [Acidimicrobiales bacterium]
MILRTAPWRRAPLLLRRAPGVMAAVAGACAVLAASLAAVPLFSSSVGSASVAQQVGERCPRDTGVTRAGELTPSSVRTPPPDPFAPVENRLRPRGGWAHVDGVPFQPLGGDRLRITLLARDGGLDHVDVIDRAPGRGAWISDRLADLTGLGAGDVTTVGTTSVPIAGVYRDLSGTSVDPFWCSNGDLLLVDGPDLAAPPPVVLVDRATLADLMGALDVPVAQGAWEAGLRPDLTISEVDDLAGALACRHGIDELAWCRGGDRPRVPSTEVGPFRGGVDARDEADFMRRFLGSSMPFVVDRARATQTSVAAGIWATAALAALAGVGLVAAATSLWYERRRRELHLLTVRGVSPAALGLKGCLELSGPLLVGSVAGVLLAYAGVTALGPSTRIEGDALSLAVVTGVGALVLAIATVGGVVAVRTSPPRAPVPHRVRIGSLPWELPLLVVTLASYHRLGRWGVPIGQGAQLSRVDLWGLLFPVLFLVTAVAAASRVLSWSIRPLRRATSHRSTALYLGVRRIARHRVAVIGLVAASAVSAGVLAYAATMDRTLEASLDAKGRMFVGADVAVQVRDDTEVPAGLASTATSVRDYSLAWFPGQHRVSVRVVAIDPATFAQAAFWDGSLDHRPLEDLLAELDAPGADGRTRAIVIGTPVQPGADLTIQGRRRVELTIDPIEGVGAFPAMRPFQPTVYVTGDALDPSNDGFDRELWFRGDHDAIVDALAAAALPYQERRTFAGIADRASFDTVTWTFGFLQSLGIAAGLLVVGGVAVHLDARRRQRLLGYTFMRRMGLTRSQHRRALGVELAASVVVGSWLGLGIAVAGAALVHTRIDPVPLLLPDPLLRVPLGTVTGLAAVSVGLTVLTVVLAQRRVDRDDPLEVLRAGA